MTNLKDVINSIVDEINAMTQEELIADFEMHSDGVFSELYRDHGLALKTPFPTHYQMLSNTTFLHTVKYGQFQLNIVENLESANETPFEMAA